MTVIWGYRKFYVIETILEQGENVLINSKVISTDNIFKVPEIYGGTGTVLKFIWSYFMFCIKI